MKNSKKWQKNKKQFETYLKQLENLVVINKILFDYLHPSFIHLLWNVDAYFLLRCLWFLIDHLLVILLCEGHCQIFLIAWMPHNFWITFLSLSTMFLCFIYFCSVVISLFCCCCLLSSHHCLVVACFLLWFRSFLVVTLSTSLHQVK